MAIFRSHPSAGTFATIIRTLLVRIRAFEASKSGNLWPPSAATGGELYRVAPTTWGVKPAGDTANESTPSAAGAMRRDQTPASTRRRRLEIPIFRLPVPRGLPAS